MKRFTKILSTLALAAALCFIMPVPKHKYPVTLQQKASHMIVFLDKDGVGRRQCTATAIGPHAILTAEHCNDAEDEKAQNDTVTLDLSSTHYHLLAKTMDHRDHVIYLLDGPAFKNFLEPSSLVNVRAATAGEKVFMYGDGKEYFPPRRVDGVVDVARQIADVSDVDQDQQLRYYTLTVLDGDSGSAVYGEDNRVLGVITYGYEGPGAAGFSLNFSEETITIAHEFSIEKIMEQMTK